MGKGSGKKRKRSEKGKEKVERTSDEDHSSDEEPLVKKAKVAGVVTEDMPPPIPESVEGEAEQCNEVEDRVEGEAEQPQVAEGLAELREDSWILRTAAVEYLQERRRLNLNRLGDWAQEQEESSDEGSKCNYDWA